MKKKGFTLIELLAVIVILAIIALIVTPTISKIIDNTKKEAFKQSVVGILRSGEYYIAKHVLETNGLEITYPIEFTCNGESCSHDDVSLAFQGATPKGGKIIVESRKEVIAELITDGKYCASGTKTNIQIAKNCSDIDTIKPIISGVLNSEIFQLTMSDVGSGLDSYCVTTSDSTENCTWIPNTASSVSHELESAGTYYAFAKDKKGNISDSVTVTANDDNFCAFTRGHEFNTITTVGITEFEVPCKGLYKLEVWGAAGGTYYNVWSASGKGGHSTGYIELTKSTHLYVVAGGAGVGTWCGDDGCNYNGGYNGGGRVHTGGNSYVGAGGGATHIAKVTGTLAQIGYDSFVTQGNGLIVAGGGGGGCHAWGKYGGSGGGTNGGGGTAGSGACTTGGSQTTGGPSGYSGGSGTFGQGGTYYVYSGGGGFYGGAAVGNSCGGSGGSGWIGGVPELTYKGAVYSPSMENGINESSGYAKITLVDY